MPSWCVWNPREGEKRLLVFWLLLLGIILTFEKSLSSHGADKTTEIILRMPQAQMTLQVIMVQRHTAEWNLPIHPHLWSRSTTNDVLVSLTIPIQGTVHQLYVNCTWMGRALHKAEHSGGRLPFTFTPTHTFANHILMQQQRFTDFSWNHGQTDIQHAPVLLENHFSWSTGICRICEHRLNDQQARWMWF